MFINKILCKFNRDAINEIYTKFRPTANCIPRTEIILMVYKFQNLDKLSISPKSVFPLVFR